MTHIDLTDEERKQVMDMFESYPGVVKLRQEILYLAKTKNPLRAAQVQGRINQLKQRYLEELMNQVDHVSVQMDEMNVRMTDEELDMLTVDLNMVFILADMLEVTSMEINELLQRYDPTMQFADFVGLNKITQECRLKMSWMGKVATDKYQRVFGDSADNLREMVVNKVRSLIRKSREDGTGKNHNR